MLQNEIPQPKEGSLTTSDESPPSLNGALPAIRPSSTYTIPVERPPLGTLEVAFMEEGRGLGNSSLMLLL